MKSLEFYFNLIYRFYGNQCAKRSKVPKIAHIIEGLNVLDKIDASENAKKAFCIHPIIQDTLNLKSYPYLHAIDGEIMMLAMEYRHIANSYLSSDIIDHYNDIKLSPFEDVNKMLIADKIQNYKDFIKYQQEHPKNNELFDYFNNWFCRLGLVGVDFSSLVEACYNTAVTIRFYDQVNGKYLLLNRYSYDRTMTGQCHPGGKVDKTEGLFEALQRECKEEIGIDLDLNTVEFFDVFFAKTKKGLKSVFTFTSNQKITPVLNTNEFHSMEWVTREKWDEFWESDIEVDYERHNFYGVDLDGTILEDAYPELGKPILKTVDYLKNILNDKTNHVIVWTMRHSNEYENILKYLREDLGLRILGINEHLTQHEWTDSPKLYADFFIDDRNIRYF